MDKNVQELFDDLTKDLGFIYSGANEYYDSYLTLLLEKEQATPISEILRSQNSEWREKIECHLKVLSNIENEKREELSKQKEKREELKEREENVKNRENAVAKEENKDDKIKELERSIEELRNTIENMNVEIGEKNTLLEEQIKQLNQANSNTTNNIPNVDDMISRKEVERNYNLKSESVLNTEYKSLLKKCKQYMTMCDKYKQKYGEIDGEIESEDNNE